ncbi:hypothetical protein BR93DRAFT_237738 [Coniochaeta sp. PMI_546]|nr:hypothetical protein BR93DRAFT_237738 [Coniochaeta sp. PMI_546]
MTRDGALDHLLRHHHSPARPRTCTRARRNSHTATSLDDSKSKDSLTRQNGYLLMRIQKSSDQSDTATDKIYGRHCLPRVTTRQKSKVMVTTDGPKVSLNHETPVPKVDYADGICRMKMSRKCNEIDHFSQDCPTGGMVGATVSVVRRATGLLSAPSLVHVQGAAITTSTANRQGRAPNLVTILASRAPTTSRWQCNCKDPLVPRRLPQLWSGGPQGC